MPKKKPFVFNDESVKNSYGFSIPTKGISLKRFKKNPVMLDSHYNSTHSVLGYWENITTDKGLLTGVPVFDSEDENVTVIEGKVERGFIKSCSMGISFNREDLKLVAGVLILEKCELYEVSIVAVPSNANSIRLYADGSETPLTDDEVQNLCLSVLPVDAEEVKPNENNPENKYMKKVMLTVLAALALGFKETELEHDVEDINTRVQKLGAEKTALELKLEILEGDAADAAKKGIEAKVDLAIKANPTLAKNRDKFVALGLQDEALLNDTLGAMPKKASLGAQIDNPGSPSEVKTAEEFQSLSIDAQLAFKNDNPEAYAKLLTQK
ncbi:HK97 family phage prohead protease [Winogradskyella undariae]|uniref:HK97 family phage prohead protease n=1 Tax=Winogradskyella undariae TaxID=1285465 RepID=UPI00156AC3E2|nr:HK97 family phage prohead protease [Winogradskyella undariae]NRR90651.1 HK97 family phage prohead protease [Winogradskyella undariae]